MRKCFVQDDSSHWFAIPVDKRGFFNELLDRGIEEDDFSDFEEEFGGDQLNYHISLYSFENLEEINED